MGRPKQFDREKILDKASELFHRYGFSATSTQQLVDGLGINRKSMYAEFGNKQGLFEAVLARYDEITVTTNFGPLETPTAGLPEIEEVLNFFARASRGKGSGLGCLLCNTAVERAANDKDTRPFAHRYVRRMSGAFQNALENAQRAGEVAATVDVVAQSRFFTTTVLGMAVLARAKTPPTIVEGTAQVAIAHLASLAS